MQTPKSGSSLPRWTRAEFLFFIKKLPAERVARTGVWVLPRPLAHVSSLIKTPPRLTHTIGSGGAAVTREGARVLTRHQQVDQAGLPHPGDIRELLFERVPLPDVHRAAGI